MSAKNGTAVQKIDSFDLAPGRRIAGKYEIRSLLGWGWEGEVYKVTELKTGITRAAKVFFPQRNERDRAVKFYATKLDRLRRCPIVTQYHHSEVIRYHGQEVTCLISEFVEGELLSKLIARQPGRRFRPFEAMHLLYALTCGLDDIHKQREYHGDIHSENVLVRRRGIFFDVKLVDFFHHGPSDAGRIREDVIQLVGLFHEILGGRRHYASQPAEVKAVCKGLRRDLIARQFPNARRLREHLESFAWS